MMNTITKVTMLVLVLMTSCHVSENPRSGPVRAQNQDRDGDGEYPGATEHFRGPAGEPCKDVGSVSIPAMLTLVLLAALKSFRYFHLESAAAPQDSRAQIHVQERVRALLG
jgi:hypothetical protein